MSSCDLDSCSHGLLLETAIPWTTKQRMAYFVFFGVTLLLALLGGLFSRVAAEKYWM